MNSQRGQVSTIAIAMLITSLVIVVRLSAPTCYATEPPYNETGAKEFDPEDLPWTNDTDIIILPPPPPPPVPVNDTDVVIIVTDPLDELAKWIDHLNTNLQDLTREFFLLQTDYNADIEELNSKTDSMETALETYSNEVNDQIENLENKITRLQTTILYAYIAIAVTVIGGFYFIKRMR